MKLIFSPACLLAIQASAHRHVRSAANVRRAQQSSSVSELALQQLETAVGSDNIKLTNIPDPYVPNFWNITPSAFVTPESALELQQVLEYCKSNSIQCVLRSFDGHSFVGQSTTDQVVVSMSKMRGVNLTTAKGGPNGDQYEVELGSGISLMELYTQLGANWKALGADLPLGFNGGSCASVGFSGLVLGGGMGVMSSRYGWAADMITAAEVVVYNKTVDAYETVIANYTHHKDLLKALKGGMGGNYGAVTRWWTKVFAAPRAIYLNFHHNSDDSNRTESIHYMRSYMEYAHAPSLDGTTPLANNSLWAQVHTFDSFKGLCLCNTDNCTDCNKAINYIQTSILNSPNNCTGKDYLNSCTVKEASLAETNWDFAGCGDLYPGDDASWDLFEAALTDCLDKNASGFQDHSSLFLSKDIAKNEDFFETAWQLNHNRTYAGDLEIDIITGAQTKPPTDCGEDECTTVQHRTEGWHIQFHTYWSDANETTEYKAWMKEAREALFPLEGSLETSYQNYLSELIGREEWKTQYFPGTTDGKPTYEFLQDVKCEYNALNTFGRQATEGYEIEVPANCLDTLAEGNPTSGQAMLDGSVIAIAAAAVAAVAAIM